MHADPFQLAALPRLTFSFSAVFVRLAIDLRIDDAIVLLMSRQTQEGADLLRLSRPEAAACNNLLSGPVTEVRAPTVAQAVDSSCDLGVRQPCVFNKPINVVYTGSESRDECVDAL